MMVTQSLTSLYQQHMTDSQNSKQGVLALLNLNIFLKISPLKHLTFSISAHTAERLHFPKA